MIGWFRVGCCGAYQLAEGSEPDLGFK
eukprot:gene1001-biopygen9413